MNEASKAVRTWGAREKAILEWWQLVKPGGHLILLVPDEDLYEQDIFPSRFNGDHKFTFTLSKAQSWSPVSIHVLDLVQALPENSLAWCSWTRATTGACTAMDPSRGRRAGSGPWPDATNS